MSIKKHIGEPTNLYAFRQAAAILLLVSLILCSALLIGDTSPWLKFWVLVGLVNLALTAYLTYRIKLLTGR